MTFAEIRSRHPGNNPKDFLLVFGRLLFSLPTLTYVLLCLAAPYFFPAVLYIVLLTYLVTPSGFLAWLAVIFASALVLGGFWIGFGPIVRAIPHALRAGKCKKAGDFEGHEMWKGRYRNRVDSLSLWAILAPAYAIVLLIPVAAALVFGSSEPNFLVRDHGKPRLATREENVRHILLQLKSRGIFTPLD